MGALHYKQLRGNRYALAHNWRLRIEGGTLRGDLFGALKNRGLEKILENFDEIDGWINIACTSSTLPSYKIKVLSEKIRGIPIHQAAGAENLQGSINLIAHEYADYRLSKLFEAWKLVEANKYTLAQDSMARLKNGVNLDLLDTDKNTVVMTYRLLETYCSDSNTGQLGNDPNLVMVNFTLSYMNFDVLGSFKTGGISQVDLGNSEHSTAILGIYGHSLS
jgi:hypothetical protein